MKSFNRGRIQIWGWLVAVFWVAAGLSSEPLQAQQAGIPEEVLHYADTVLYNGKVLTVDA